MTLLVSHLAVEMIYFYYCFVVIFIIFVIHDTISNVYSFPEMYWLHQNFLSSCLRNFCIGTVTLFLIGFLSGTLASLAVGTHFAIGNGVLVGLSFSLFNCFPYIQYFSLRLTLWLTDRNALEYYPLPRLLYRTPHPATSREPLPLYPSPRARTLRQPRNPERLKLTIRNRVSVRLSVS